MSTIQWTPFRPGDPRDAAAVQAVFAALATESAGWDAENYAPEGFDRRVLYGQPAWRVLGTPTIVNTRPAASLALTGAFIPLVHNGTPLRVTLGAFSLLAGEALRMRAWMSFESTVAAGTGVTGTLEALWYWSSGGGTVIPGSLGVLGRNPHGGAGIHARNEHGVCWSEAVLVGPQVVDWGEIRYTLAGGAGTEAFPTRSILWFEHFKRWA